MPKNETLINPHSHKHGQRFIEERIIEESLSSYTDLSSIESSSSFFNADQNSSICSCPCSGFVKLEESYQKIPSPKTPVKKISNNDIKAIILNSGGTIDDYKVIKKWVNIGLILPK
jgi:hypothetical protein